MKTLPPTLVASTAVLLLTALPTSAIDWRTTDVVSDVISGESRRISDVAVDNAGRVHTVFVTNNGSATAVQYRMRANAAEGFSGSGFRGLVTGTTAGSAPRDISIDVTPDFVVQAAIVDEEGIVRVFELTSDASSWSNTIVAEDAWGETTTGVSLRSRGNGGFSRSALVYTRSSGANPNGVSILNQNESGSWSSPSPVFSGLDTGLAPVLINVDPRGTFPNAQRVIASYNDAENRVDAVREVRNGITLWQNSVQVGNVAASNFTRIDGDAFANEAGVAFVSSGNSDNTRNGVYFGRLSPGSTPTADSWSVVRSTASDENDPERSEAFGSTCGLTFDAAGIPLVAYSRFAFPIFGALSLDIRVRRFMPDLGWKLSVVEDLPSALGRVTDTLALASGENGDPALVYERDLGPNESTHVFARPVSAPWVVSIPEELTDARQNFAPALASNPDGSFHLITSRSIGGGFGIPTPSPVQYINRKLVTFSKGTTIETEIPKFGKPSCSECHHHYAGRYCPRRVTPAHQPIRQKRPSFVFAGCGLWSIFCANRWKRSFRRGRSCRRFCCPRLGRCGQFIYGFSAG